MIVPDDDLSREVYGVLGIPLDRSDIARIVRKIETSVDRAAPFLMSTPNLNFMVTSWSDSEFRESLLTSDVCVPDGMSVVWLARLIGVPIRERVPGSDIFEALKSLRSATNPIKTFLFGAGEGVAEMAGKRLNATPEGLICVGSHYPAYGSVYEMSAVALIEEINASGADFLVVALGAKKGQLWLRQNHRALRIPIRSHLGAVVNFQADTVRRAPLLWRKWSLEWLWRIKEEPLLWRRYWSDGRTLLPVIITRVLPLGISMRWHQYKSRWLDSVLSIECSEDSEIVTISLIGDATAGNVSKASSYFRAALACKRRIVIDLSALRFIDPRFIGLLLMLRKQLAERQQYLEFVGTPPHIARIICLNYFGFLLTANTE